jgi:hypothetical protein
VKNGSLLVFIFLIFQVSAFSQSDTIRMKARIIDGDTIPVYDLTEISIISPQARINPDELNRISRLIHNIKKVYPYAKLAKIKLDECNALVAKAGTKREQKRIIRQFQDDLQSKYGGELRNLSFTQGKILIKLLDRETGNSSYDLVKELRGSFMAFFWQSLAGLWGYDLKSKYDPNGADQELEIIVKLIETGGI